jgi:hypothetical protein
MILEYSTQEKRKDQKVKTKVEKSNEGWFSYFQAFSDQKGKNSDTFSNGRLPCHLAQDFVNNN